MTGIWVAADTISAVRMNEKTVFQGTGAAISGLAITYSGMLAFCTSSGSGFTKDLLYVRNTANTSWDAIGLDDAPYLTPSTTIGDYTSPNAATATSTRTSALTLYDSFATDNFTDVGTGIGVSGGVLGGSFNRSATNNGSYRGITALSDTIWVAQFKMIINSVSAETNGVYIGFTDLDGNTDSNTARDGLGLFIRYDGGLFSTICAPNGVTWGTTITDMTTAPSVTTIYVTMRRISATSFTIAYSSTDSYTEDIEVKNFTVNSAIVGLDNFVMQGMMGSASTDDFDIDIDDLRIWDATNTTTDREFYLLTNIYDTDTTTWWESNSEASPAVYVDLSGSAREIVGIALNINTTNTTITSIKIRASTDTSFADAENIMYVNISDFTNGTWRFLPNNFLSTNTRYVQIIGVGTGVLAINEIKVRYGVSDLVKILTHKHNTRDVSAANIFNADSN